MIIGLGVDIIEKKRIKKILLKKNKYFEKKILNKLEKKVHKKNTQKISYLAKIFSIKEAFIKSIGTGFNKDISFKKIKILKNNIGKPKINNKYFNVLISVSHEKNIIISISLILSKK